ncbi:TetR/AcrR family transcriptional regulator [Thalassobacillus pellis]|uniref:TetR/AcrR family transcriptional regulator n=1 Tax=Thalassobacillus pellis TaxID=748008 RepID=UPI00195F280C|nr:TetR/AcrR family transcriptional regulator [Thalassobacillus pellis]MBM7553432.1 AcrR family transcriptional regulator [Thalassobacillus pellis]
MAGLREEKKKQNQRNIIQTARKIFTEKGYANTTMTTIAKEANVGTGTIYNYYPSKGALLLTIFTEEVAELEKENEIYMKPASGSLIDTVMALMKDFTGFFDLYSKEFWREIMHVMTEETDESIQLRRGLFGLDEEAMQWVEEVIEVNEDRFIVPVNPKEAASAVYGVTLMQTMNYIYEEEMTKAQFLQQLHKQIEFIFTGKLKG